ncbi:MAG: hydroxyisourate hydrolase [Pseudomonadota bacterium]
MSGLSTHVLDLTTGRPAVGVRITLHMHGEPRTEGVTDTDGRCKDLLSGEPLEAGRHKIAFDIGAYFSARGHTDIFLHEVTLDFEVKNPDEHHHVPLLATPFAASTYRGS